MTRPSDLTRRQREKAQREREDAVYEERIRLLQAELAGVKKRVVSHETVRQEILKLSKATVPQPSWTMEPQHGKGLSPGAPTLFLSDWHWGEVVDKRQVGGVNEYNLQIAHNRAQTVIQNTIRLLRGEFSRKELPGLVVALGGDMFSGDIHEELSRTNEQLLVNIS